MAIPVATILKKLAVAVISDRRSHEFVAAIVLGGMLLILLPAAVLLALLPAGTEGFSIDVSQIMCSMPADARLQIEHADSVFSEIDEVILMQKMDIDSEMAKNIFLVLLMDYHGEERDIVKDYLQCFDGNTSLAAFISRIESAFDITVSDEQKEKIAVYFKE